MQYSLIISLSNFVLSLRFLYSRFLVYMVDRIMVLHAAFYIFVYSTLTKVIIVSSSEKTWIPHHQDSGRRSRSADKAVCQLRKQREWAHSARNCFRPRSSCSDKPKFGINLLVGVRNPRTFICNCKPRQKSSSISQTDS